MAVELLASHPGPLVSRNWTQVATRSIHRYNSFDSFQSICLDRSISRYTDLNKSTYLDQFISKYLDRFISKYLSRCISLYIEYIDIEIYRFISIDISLDLYRGISIYFFRDISTSRSIRIDQFITRYIDMYREISICIDCRDILIFIEN
jgi:hypothetical protein